MPRRRGGQKFQLRRTFAKSIQKAARAARGNNQPALKFLSSLDQYTVDPARLGYPESPEAGTGPIADNITEEETAASLDRYLKECEVFRPKVLSNVPFRNQFFLISDNNLRLVTPARNTCGSEVSTLVSSPEIEVITLD